MIELTPRLKLIAAAVIALVVGFLVGTFALTVPSPRVIGLDHTAQGVSLHGVTSRDATVIAFTTDGAILDVLHASASGQFTFEALVPATGTHEIVLRALNAGWRASPPTHVDLRDILASDIQTATTTPAEPIDDDLPPLAIPPTSTKPKVDTPTSTPREIESVAAFAGVKNASLAPKATQTVTITLKDQDGKLIPGADVQIVAHYPTEDVTYNTTGDGTYRASFKVPENIGSGTNILLDVKATYEQFNSTARASFTVK